MASEIKSAGTGGNDATVGTIDWSNPSNITASDDSRASVGGANTSRYLTGTNYGFTLQTGVTDGIKAEAKLSKANGGSESSVRLVVAGAIAGNPADDKSTGAALSDDDTYHVYGGAADKWNYALTPSIVAASNFGFGVSTVGGGAMANRRCDHMRMTHYYTAAATTNGAALFFFSVLFAAIRWTLPYAAAESFIRFLLATVIPNEQRFETAAVRPAPAAL